MVVTDVQEFPDGAEEVSLDGDEDSVEPDAVVELVDAQRRRHDGEVMLQEELEYEGIELILIDWQGGFVGSVANDLMWAMYPFFERVKWNLTAPPLTSKTFRTAPTWSRGCNAGSSQGIRLTMYCCAKPLKAPLLVLRNST